MRRGPPPPARSVSWSVKLYHAQEAGARAVIFVEYDKSVARFGCMPRIEEGLLMVPWDSYEVDATPSSTRRSAVVSRLDLPFMKDWEMRQVAGALIAAATHARCLLWLQLLAHSRLPPHPPHRRQSARELLQRAREDAARDGSRASYSATALSDSKSDSDGEAASRCSDDSHSPTSPPCHHRRAQATCPPAEDQVVQEQEHQLQIPPPRKSYPIIDKTLVPPLNLDKLPTEGSRPPDGATAHEGERLVQVIFEARVPACYVLHHSGPLLCPGLPVRIVFGAAGDNGGVIVIPPAPSSTSPTTTAAERAALRQVSASRALSSSCAKQAPAFSVRHGGVPTLLALDVRDRSAS